MSLCLSIFVPHFDIWNMPFLSFRWVSREMMAREAKEVAKILEKKAMLEMQSKMEEMWKEVRQRMDQFS